MSITREEKDASMGRIFGYIVLGIGLMFFGLAALDSIFSVDVTAKISKIEERRTVSRDMDYNVYVDYEYKGVEYKDIYISYWTNGMYEGKVMKIQINKNIPTEVYVGKHYLAFGAVFVGIGITAIVCDYKSRKNALLRAEEEEEKKRMREMVGLDDDDDEEV